MEVWVAQTASNVTQEVLENEAARAEMMLSHYPLKIGSLTLIQANDKAVVWRVETDQGPKALKWMNVRSGKAVFSILAHHYLQQRGFRVPVIVETKRNNLCLGQGEYIGFLAEWIEGRRLQRNVEEEWNLYLETLAEFHEYSKGLRTPPNVRVKTKLGSWPLEYQKKIGRMKHWLALAAERDEPYFAVYRELAPQVIENAEVLLHKLIYSEYWEWVDRQSRELGLCHGDYGESNTVLRPDGSLAVIDMDTVTHDLPIRDLRKVYESLADTAVELGPVLHRVLDTYTRFNPLTEDEIEVFLIDLQFPYKVYQNAKLAFLRNELNEMDLREQVEIDLRTSSMVQSF